jgi:broad-specificity NMP kinase
VVWINGAFGAGKTTVAQALRARWPDSLLYDPEYLGVALQRLTPRPWRRDFQEWALWRRGTVGAIRTLARTGRRVLVPMTIVEPGVFEQTVGQLQQGGLDVHHVILLASAETLRTRLRARGSAEDAWSLQQVERCGAGLPRLPSTLAVTTDTLRVEEVVEQIAGRLRT